MAADPTAGVRLESTTLHGHRVAYRVAGDPSLPVLLLVHGLTSSSATWEPVMASLGEHAHVIAVDLPGHGSSDKPRGDYSLGAFAAVLRDLLEKLGHTSATIVGHSFGGGVALQFAYQFPEYVERIVLVSSGGLGREVSWVLRAAALPGAEFVLPIVAHHWIADAGTALASRLAWLPVRPAPSVLEAARGYASLADLPTRSAFVHTVRSVIDPGGQRVSARDRLYLGTGRPTLIVWGALDSIIPRGARRLGARRRPRELVRDLRAGAPLPASRRAGPLRRRPAGVPLVHRAGGRRPAPAPGAAGAGPGEHSPGRPAARPLTSPGAFATPDLDPPGVVGLNVAGARDTGTNPRENEGRGMVRPSAVSGGPRP